uniref:SAM domain-containing protein n=1 Tax=Scleropages formosus TaxID=113540 RepID=A0A8C9SCX6_SCLFO
MENWTVEEVCSYLRQQGLEQWVENFQAAQITGKRLQNIVTTALEEKDPLKQCLKILHHLKMPWKSPFKEMKVFNDPVHGHIELHPLLVCIIDTPQFQRLRHIKQMGAGYFVYPGAAHNRFEHSIGVAYLAGELLKTLRERQPELDISNRDILCVQIDMVHSHTFDGMFMPKAQPTLECKHETLSIKMFNHMVKENKLESEMEKYDLITKEDLPFIKALIYRKNTQVSSYGRTAAKSFLFDIVSNKRNGIDVDKWDYLARDCYHLGIRNNFDHWRFLKFARVCQRDGRKLICTRDKEAWNLYDMFYTRYFIHRRACHHRVKDIIENMITDAFLKADAHLNISQAVEDMDTYTKLTDHIFEEILNSKKNELKESRSILQKILCRKIYKCVGETPPLKTEEDTEVRLSVISLDYGKKEENPMKDMYFYRKQNPNEAISIEQHEVSHLLPEKFFEQIVRVYCRKADNKKVQEAKMKFENSFKEFERNTTITALHLGPLLPSDATMIVLLFLATHITTSSI